jgi:hypothetical protein
MLRYVMGRKLAGVSEESFKETVIGVDVFGKPEHLLQPLRRLGRIEQ